MKIKKSLLSLAAITSLSILNANEPAKVADVTVISSAFDAQIKQVSAQQLEDDQASDVKDILKTLPSIEVAGDARYSQKVYIRGLEDKFSNITIDGAKMGGQLFHHSGDQTVDASLLKISEIELGPNSALNGPGVVSGSFKYETKDPSDFLEEGEAFGGKASVGYETAKHRKKASLALFGKVNESVELVGIGSWSDDGDIELGDGSTDTNKHSELKSGLIKLVLKPNDDSTLKLSYNKYEDGGNRTISGEKAGSVSTDDDFNQINRDTYSLKYNYNPNNDLVELEASLYSNEQYLERSANATQPYREYTNKSQGGEIRNTSLVGNNKLTYGIDFNHEEQEKVQEKTIDGGEVDNIGIYIQDEVVLGDFTLIPGVRYDKYELGGIYDGDFNQLSPKLKTVYQASENLALRAAYGRIFKGPALGETLMLSDGTAQDADTQAQTGNNYEIGFDYDLTNALNADDSIIGFNVYTYDLSDYAHPTKNTSLSSQGEMEIWGTETMFAYNKEKLGITASHTYIGGTQKNSDGIEYDPKTTKIHTFKVGVNYQLTEEFKVNYNAQFTPGNDYTSYGINRTTKEGSFTKNERSGYAVHNMYVTYKPNAMKGFTLNVGIDNIFDKDYMRHNAFAYGTAYSNSEIGRNFKFNLSYQF